MVSAKGVIAAISVFAVAMLTTDGATSGGLEPIPPSEASFIFTAEEFSGAIPVYKKKVDEFFGTRQDLGFFMAGGAHAVIVYVQAINDETVLEPPALKDLVDSFKFNNMYEKEWGDESSVESHLGKFWVVPYRIASKIRECFGFSLEFDIDAHDYNNWRYRKLIFGYYCATMGEKFSPTKITNLIKSISIK